MKPLEILQKHCEFKTPYDCYVLLAVSRKKDTPEITNSKEIVFREIIRHKDDIVRKYNKIKNQCNNYIDDTGKKYPFYIYISLNARDSLKAFYKFQKRLIDWNEEIGRGSDQVHERIRRTDRHFISILASPECRSKNRYFMIDYDDKETFRTFYHILSEYNNIEIIDAIETRNGWHIKTKPFDRRLLNREKEIFNFEIKIDAQLFVEYIKA